MRGRVTRWEDEQQKSIVQHIIDAARKISMGAAGRSDAGVILSPYVASFFEPVDISSEEYKKQQKEKHIAEIRNAAEEWNDS